MFAVLSRAGAVGALVASLVTPWLPGHRAGTLPQVPVRPPVRTAGACLLPAPTTPSGYNAMLAHVAGWQAGDGGHTAMLDNGRRAWSFGDSLLGDNRLHHSALVIQDHGCATSVYSDKEFLPNEQCGDDPSTPTEEGWCWAGPVAYQAGRLYLLAPQLVRTPDCTGAFCFTGVGARLFVYGVPRAGKPVLQSATPVPVTAAGIFWNSAIMFSADGTLAYVYGYRDDGDPWTFGYDTYLMVTPVAALAAGTPLPSARYWSGLEPDGGAVWSTDQADARPVLGAAGGPETSVSVYANGASVILTSTADGGLGHVVTEWVAANPWGPWTTRTVADYPDTSDHMWYLPLHVAGSTVHVISQNWPNRPLSDIVKAPQDFRVQVF